MELNNGQYSLQGIPVEEIGKTYGLPLYVYDAAHILSQLERLKKAYQGVNAKIKYAAKALTNLSVLQLLRRAGAGLDVVSIHEAKIGIKAGYKAQEIMYTPSGVSFAEIEEAVALGLIINIDNIPTLRWFGQEYGGRIPCFVRVNPHVRAGGNAKIQVGHIDSKFGVSVTQMAEVRQVVNSLSIDVCGIHMHSGSDIVDNELFLAAAQAVFEAATGFPNLKYIDLGSGYKVPYKPGDKETDIEGLGKSLGSAFKDFCQKTGQDLQLWLEPGKFLVSGAGSLLVQVNVVKQGPTTVFAAVDSGLNHLIRPMMYDAYHHIVNISNPGGAVKNYAVVGYICETDTFGWDRPLNEVRPGDTLAILNAGAYGMSMSSHYNSRPRPAEVLVHEGKTHLIRQRETLDDVLRNQVDVFA